MVNQQTENYQNKKMEKRNAFYTTSQSLVTFLLIIMQTKTVQRKVHNNAIFQNLKVMSIHSYLYS